MLLSNGSAQLLRGHPEYSFRFDSARSIYSQYVQQGIDGVKVLRTWFREKAAKGKIWEIIAKIATTFPSEEFDTANTFAGDRLQAEKGKEYTVFLLQRELFHDHKHQNKIKLRFDNDARQEQLKRQTRNSLFLVFSRIPVYFFSSNYFFAHTVTSFL